MQLIKRASDLAMFSAVATAIATAIATTAISTHCQRTEEAGQRLAVAVALALARE